MHYIIYKTINLINGKYYIGKHKTKNLNDGYLGSGKLLKRAIRKYGKRNFVKEILLECSSEEEMNQKEKELVILSGETYNLCEGGFGGFGYINRNNLSIRNITKENAKYLSVIGNEKKKEKFGVNIPCWYKEKISNSLKGHENWFHNHSSETKVKMSLSHQGKHQGSKNSQYGTMWITNGIQNKKIPKNDLDKWVNQGYTKGRKMNLNARMAKLG